MDLIESDRSTILDVANASVCIDGHRLLNAVDMHLMSGELICIVGPNGAGKSTLLKAIASDIGLSSGEIVFSGKRLTQWDVRARARRLSVLPQNSSLNFPFLVEDVVALGRIPHSTGVDIDREIVRQAMSAFDISELESRPYTQLSGGEKQRVQLSRVFAQIWRAEDAGERLLILDEPVSALDLKHQQQLMDAIKMFSRSGVGVLMVLHNLQLASQYADRVIAMKSGGVFTQGPVAEVLNEQVIRSVFDVETFFLSHPVTKKPVMIL